MWQALRRLIAANPMGIFLWGIIAKWYVMMAVASLIVLFWVAKGLEQIGLINYVTTATTEILDTSKSIAQHCTPKLGPNFESLTNFWKCLGAPPKYEVHDEITGEKTLEDGLKKLLPKDGTVPEMLPYRNPYDSPENSNDSDDKSTDGK